MSNAAYNKIITKLERLDEYLSYLKDLQKVNKKSFLEDYHYYGLAERYLQLSIEVVLDIAKMASVLEQIPRPDTNQDFFPLLKTKKVISEKAAITMHGIVGFRNVLVHDYEKIDRELVYEKVQKRLDDFVVFKKDVLKYLKKSRK